MLQPVVESTNTLPPLLIGKPQVPCVGVFVFTSHPAAMFVVSVKSSNIISGLIYAFFIFAPPQANSLPKIFVMLSNIFLIISVRAASVFVSETFSATVTFATCAAETAPLSL